MTTPIDILLAVAAVDGKLGIVGDKLRMLLPADCAPELKDAIRQHKPAMLELLRLNFLVVRSDVINGFIIWTPDEGTKRSLITAGAEPGIIYTKAEIDTLVAHRVSAASLSTLHSAKSRFDGAIRKIEG